MAFTINGTSGINLATQPLTGSLPDANAPSGSVIQVVSFTTNTPASNTTTTYADTGLTLSITPTSASSKILVILTQAGTEKSSANTANGVNLQLLRDGNVLSIFGVAQLYTGTTISNLGSVSTNYLDSPATTSTVTYKTQFRNYTNAATVYVQSNGDRSSITLMEIAA